MTKFFRLIGLAIVMVTMVGCSLFQSDDHKLVDSQARHNVKILGRQLSHYQVRMFQGADRVRLLLPAQGFFVGDSANLSGNAYEALELIANLANYYEGASVAVTGCLRQHSSDVDVRALSVERAGRVVEQLRKLGIDSNFMYSNAQDFSIIDHARSLSSCVLIEFIDFSE